MRSVVTDQVVWSVVRSVTVVSPAKMAEPIGMPFGLRIQVGPRNQVLGGVPDSPFRRGNFEEEDAADCKVVQKWLNQLRCRLGFRLGWSQGIRY